MDDEDHHDWTLIRSETEYQTGWYNGGYDRLIQPDGTEKNYYWAELSDAVVIVAKNKNDELVFVHQYRPTIREQCLELPAGIVEDEESFEEAASRELIEETGFKPGTLKLIEDFWCATGVLRHRRGIVYAGQLKEVEQNRGKNEFISVTTIPVENALSTAREEPTNDATLEGILLAKNDGYI